MKEYKKMLDEGLITQEDYKKLKEKTLFQLPDTTRKIKLLPQHILIVSSKKQISQNDHLKLQQHYKRKMVGGRTLIIGSAFFGVLATAMLSVGANQNKYEYLITGTVSATISLTMLRRYCKIG